MENIKVSVIIPVYNAELYLEECLDSVINQTLKEIEIICVDDGSTDNSMRILQEYQKKDSRIVVLTQNNQNAGSARNKGLAIAKGTYLAFLDSDDFFEPDMLMNGYLKLEEDGSDIVVFKAQQYDVRTGKTIPMPWSCREERYPKVTPFSPEQMANYLFNSFQNWPWNKMFRHSFIRENRITYQEIARTNDMAFVCVALALAKKISIIPKAFVTYRVGTGTSLQSTNSNSPVAFWEASKETKRRLQQLGLYEKYEQSLLNAVLGGSFYNLNSVNKGSKAYWDIRSQIKYQGEEDFGFASHDETYYYDAHAYAEYMKIKNERKSVKGDVQKPKVSVVIPSLNARMYIRECIESVLDQTLRDIEVICVDAGSTDGTVEVLEWYAERDKRVKIIYSNRKSYGYQMNLGISSATGEYLGIVEADDYVLPEMYEQLYGLAVKYQLEGIKSDYQIFVDEDKRKFTYRALTKNKEFYGKVINPKNDLEIFRASNINTPGIYLLDFIKKNDIKLNETPGASFQDNGLWFQIFVNINRLYFHPSAFYMIRRDNPNSSVNSRAKTYCMCDEYDYIRGVLRKNEEIDKCFASVCAFYRFCNYEWTLGRIAEELKLEFLRRFSCDFRRIRDDMELERDMFSREQWEKLQMIIDDPENYYYAISKRHAIPVLNTKDTVASEKEIIDLKLKLSAANRRIDFLNQEIRNINNSKSFRIGRKITWFPRKIRGGVKCYKEHGFFYTWNRLLIHLGIKKEFQQLNKNDKEVENVGNIETKNIQESLKVDVKKDYNYYANLPIEKYPEELAEWYEKKTGKKLDLSNPKTFNEKIQWLKLYDSTPLKTQLADKYLVRNWISKNIGENYLIPLLGVYENFDDINFDKLPQRFVMKANHGSGWNVVVKNKDEVNWADIKQKFVRWMGKNYAFENGFELHYKDITPKIIVEEYIAELSGDIYDYRFFCFNGVPKYIWVDLGSGTASHFRNIYNLDWELQDYTVNWPQIIPEPEKPNTLKEMIGLAHQLSQDFSFVRVDFYSVEGKIYFGEMTFTPQSGLAKWEFEEVNDHYGDLITLPKKSEMPKKKWL